MQTSLHTANPMSIGIDSTGRAPAVVPVVHGIHKPATSRPAAGGGARTALGRIRAARNLSPAAIAKQRSAPAACGRAPADYRSLLPFIVVAVRWIGRAGEHCRAHRRRRTALRALQSLNDHTLTDIGLRRSEIRAVVHEIEADTRD